MTSVFFAPPTWSTIVLIVACATATGVALWQARRWPSLIAAGTVLCGSSWAVPVFDDLGGPITILINVLTEAGRLLLLIAVLTALTVRPARSALPAALAAAAVIGYTFGLPNPSPHGWGDHNTNAIVGILAALIGTGFAVVGPVRRPTGILSPRRIWTAVTLMATPPLAGALVGISPQPGADPRRVVIIISCVVIGVGVVLGIMTAGRSTIRPAALALIFAGVAMPLALAMRAHQLAHSHVNPLVPVLGLLVGLGLLFVPGRAVILIPAITMLGLGVLFGHVVTADDPYQLYRALNVLPSIPIVLSVTVILILAVGTLFLTDTDRRETVPATYTALLATLYYGVSLSDLAVSVEPGNPPVVFPGGTLLTSGVLLLAGAVLLLVIHVGDVARRDQPAPARTPEPGPAPIGV